MERCIANGLFHGVHRLSLPPQKNFGERLQEKCGRFRKAIKTAREPNEHNDTLFASFSLCSSAAISLAIQFSAR